MTRLRYVGHLLLLCTFEAGAVVALRRAGSIERWNVPWDDLGRWLDQAPPADVAGGLGRYLALCIAYWLCASTVLFVLASASRQASLIRFAGAMTLPGVRRSVERAAMVGVSLSMLAPASAAMAHGQRPAVVWHDPASAAPADAQRPAAATDHAGVVVVEAVAPSALTTGSWKVVPQDNLWVIAEATIAHAQGIDVDDVRMADLIPYWRELCDAASETLRSGDPDLIYPGEVALLPAYRWTPPAAETPPAPPPAPTVPAPAPPVTPPTVPPTTAPAPQRVEKAPEAPTAATTAPAPLAAPAPLLAPDPALVADEGVDEGVDEAAVVPTTAAPAPADRAPVAASSRPARPVSQLLGYGLLGAGVLAAVDWRRRERARRRTPGTSAPAPAPEVAAVETALRAGAEVDSARFLTAGLRALAAVASRLDPGELAPLGVLSGPDGLEIVMGGRDVTTTDGRRDIEAPGARPVTPFGGTPARWLLEHPADEADLADLEALGEGMAVPVPALVSLGKNAEGAEVLVDLEDAGMVCVVGEGAAEVVTAAAFALACPPWDDLVDVLCVGFASPPSGPGVRAVDDLDAGTCAALAAQAQECAILLESTGSPVAAPYGSTLEARIAGVAEETWVPTVVVCAVPPSPAIAAHLLGLVNDPAAHGIAVLVAGDVAGAPCELVIRPDDGMLVDFLDTTVIIPQRVRAGEARGMAAMLAGASAPAVARDPGPVTEPGPVVVRVLGPIEVTGPGGPLVFSVSNRAAKAAEAIVYLACHPGVETPGERVRAALWPDGTGGHFSAVMHTARLALLGVDPSGALLPKMAGSASRYRTGPGVVSDVDLLHAALDARDAGALRSGLALVRGEPFTTPGRGYEWAVAEGAAVRAAEVAADAALCLVDLALDADDVATARWAAEAGLMASPGQEAVLRALMRCEAAAGNQPGIDAAFQRAAVAAEDLGAEPSPVTAALRRELLSA